MLTLYYGPGACSMASHIVLEESGEKYEPKRMDLAKGEQRTPEYLKMNPQGRVPLLQLDNGEPLAEESRDWRDTAIVPRNGSITFRTRFLDFTGKFVLHCHMMNHEELGMMQVIEVVAA